MECSAIKLLGLKLVEHPVFLVFCRCAYPSSFVNLCTFLCISEPTQDTLITWWWCFIVLVVLLWKLLILNHHLERQELYQELGKNTSWTSLRKEKLNVLGSCSPLNQISYLMIVTMSHWIINFPLCKKRYHVVFWGHRQVRLYPSWKAYAR